METKQKTRTKIKSIMLPEDLWRELKYLTIEHQVIMPDIIRMLLKKYKERNK